MSFFPKISFQGEVEKYLSKVFRNNELITALGTQEAESKYQSLLSHLSHPPGFTTVRVNTHLASVEHVKKLLFEEIQKQFKGLYVPIFEHPKLQDILLIPVIGPSGMGIRMTEPVYLSPSFDNVLPSHLFLQNLPSVVVSHILNPQPGERILDMCAAPGGKATHLATLMHDQGEVIAMDKTANKVKKIKQNAELLQLNCIKAFCYDGTKALAVEKRDEQEGPPFLPESFHRILLDAPCSGMGQRPNMVYSLSLKEVTSYQPLQRKLFTVAVNLLKPGGVLVYSTCTITLSENEEQVAWALRTFPCLQLQPQEPHIGGEGMRGAGLSLAQLKLLQRFDPSAVTLQGMDINSLQDSKEDDLISLANKDCIGFFIAKFMKLNSK
ncbi:tRNA (cytosine(72)-C(5))-methyltransferase NSUN6 isoform X3 [Colius striatus]|uniref:tRNA (cytosine(72)-C(5))-methyltransferase NSUN6 isoform X3 n=1 Tax=Colius striatus TaxID=57412 RepID=UPI002B1D280A|nr:tRNA (cytosine(72)-C(5))-methyltransferase NSUN6 isoform X3 [Colius striatus]